MAMCKARIGALALLLLGASVGLAYEEPAYRVIAELDGLEYRRYQPYLVAQTVVAERQRDRAANAGFRRLFDYISGANVDQAKIDMTTPVQQQPTGRAMEMTTPVQQSPAADGWTVAFVVPREFTLQTVPSPTDPAVAIRKVPAQLRAVLRFSGRWTDRNVNAHKAELIDKLAVAGVQSRGPVMTAFYNAPFSLPFMRRNEVMVRLDELPAAVHTAASK